ncbi:MAG: Thymidylate synthase complementing protein [Bacteriophage sp.]|nr:MAG: Thymidylate synthase complementing protein [Bacteriophage sp.]
MKIIQPKVELWQQGEDKVAHVARCARICYKKETGNDSALYGSLERRNHLSMYRHETYYAAVPTYKKDSIIWQCLAGYMHCPYIKWVTYKNNTYIITNGNFIRDIVKDNPVLFHMIYDNQITSEEAEQIEPIWEHFMRYTFCVVTQISTSRELNRVSPNNIAEQSTRYVYEDGTICKPHWMTDEEVDYLNNEPIFEEWCNSHKKASIFRDSCNDSFNKYKLLVDIGMQRQDARGVLPIDTATKCAYTYSIDEWRAIINLRYYGTTGAPHPNAKIVAGMIRQQLMDLGYVFK